VNVLLIERIGPASLLLLSAAMMELVAQSVRRLVRAPVRERTAPEERPIGGGAFSGIRVVFASPYLLAIAGYTLMASLAGTWGYANNVLFTVVDREQKYKSKAFIDTVIYRGGDALTSVAVAGVLGLGAGIRGAALVALPLGLVWLVIAIVVGRMHQRVAQQP